MPTPLPLARCIELLHFARIEHPEAFWNLRLDHMRSMGDVRAILRQYKHHVGRPGYALAAQIEGQEPVPPAPPARRFFPLQAGDRFHPVDLAVDRVLGLALAMDVSLYREVLHELQDGLSLASLAWAVTGHSPGWAPEAVIDQVLRNSLGYRDLPVELDLRQAKRLLLEQAEHAREIFPTLPLCHVGCLYLDHAGHPQEPNADAVARGELRLHPALC